MIEVTKITIYSDNRKDQHVQISHIFPSDKCLEQFRKDLQTYFTLRKIDDPKISFTLKTK